jgi:hypothetical protein
MYTSVIAFIPHGFLNTKRNDETFVATLFVIPQNVFICILGFIADCYIYIQLVKGTSGEPSSASNTVRPLAQCTVKPPYEYCHAEDGFVPQPGTDSQATYE